MQIKKKKKKKKKKKRLTYFALLLNLSFLGRKLETANLFVSVLTDLVSCIVLFA